MDLPIIGVTPSVAGKTIEEIAAMHDDEGNLIVNVGDMVDFVYGSAVFISSVKDDVNPDDAFLYHYAKK